MKNLRKKITGLIVAASIMSIGVVSMAATSGTTSDSKRTYQSNAEGKMTEGRHGGKGGFAKDGIGKGNMEDTLKSLVSAGTITQEESDKILALSKEKAAARQAEITRGLNDLVTAGTITQEQLDKIVGYMSTLETNKPAKDSTLK